MSSLLQPETESAAPVLSYEQPLSERMRTFLRLEFLYQQALFHAEVSETWGTRAAVDSLLEILAILSRGDVRGEVLKELERHSGLLRQYQSRAGVDPRRLQVVLDNVEHLRNQLGSAAANITQDLKENEFLNAIKHRSAIPGGTCEFDLPIYSHWLNREYPQRAEDFEIWIGKLRPLCDGVAEVLWLTRESADQLDVTARGGLYQHALEKGSNRELLCVTLPAKSDCFPEISGSQHRFTVRFLTWADVSQRPVQTSQDVSFQLRLS